MGLLDDLKKSIDNVVELPVLSSVTALANQSLATLTKPSKSKEVKTTQLNTSVPINTSVPTSVWERIGCTPKTMEFIKMALEDGVIDGKERALLMRRVEEDGVDLQEFDFVMAKALEAYQKMAKNSIKEMSTLFSTADKMATKAMKLDKNSLSSQLPNIISKNNPYLFVSTIAMDTIGNTISSFIKAPTKLNTFKAEIIRIMDIPLLPEVLVDFFGYVSSQIQEESQRNKGKGLFSEWGEFFHGKDINLIPIWRDKMKHVMTKAVIRFGNNIEVMRLLEEWRESPLKQLRSLSDPELIENFPIPGNVSDYIALVKYTYEKGESIKTTFREAFAKLNLRLIKEYSNFINLHQAVGETIRNYKVRIVNLVMSNCDNPVFMIQFKTPTDLNDLLEVLHFLSTRKDMKKYHQRIFDEGLHIFSTDEDAINKIKQFKPKSFLGF